MTDLKLQPGEGILLQADEAGLYDGHDEISIDELYLTNRNLIYVHSVSKGLFKSETIVDKIPLSEISIVNGVVQVEIIDDDDYGTTLQLIYTSGKRELLEIDDSSENLYPLWKNGVIDAVQKCDREIDKTTSQEQPAPPPIDSNVRTVFCNQCGKKTDSSAKFCTQCGAPIYVDPSMAGSTTKQNSTTESAPRENQQADKPPRAEQTARKTVYEGKLHKCPGCGELIQSFTGRCPACGLEFRDKKSTSSVEELSAKLEAIEAERPHRAWTPLNLVSRYQATDTDEKKISLIRSFAIPNTREDLYEFMILSLSNINVFAYDELNSFSSGGWVGLSDAWRAKFEQACEKARLMFPDDPQFIALEGRYQQKNNSVKKAKRRPWLFIGISFGSFFLLLIILIVLVKVLK